MHAEMDTGKMLIVAVTLFDAGTPPVAFDELPDGATLDFQSSNPAVAPVEVMPGGLTAKIRSAGVGGATITCTPGGSLEGKTIEPLTVDVVHAQPGQLRMTVGEPVDEDDPSAPPADTTPPAGDSGGNAGTNTGATSGT